MKPGFDSFLNSVRFMKRFLLSSLLLLAMGHTAYCYVNNGVVQSPPMDVSLLQINDPVFVNRGVFSVDLTLEQNPVGATIPFETSDTKYFTNSGTMIGSPGFDLENFPSSVGQPQMASIFVNTNVGVGGGIYVSNSIIVEVGGIQNPIDGILLNLNLVGQALFKVRATNIVDSGIIHADNIGLIDMAGKDVNLNRAQIAMSQGIYSPFAFGFNGFIFGPGGIILNPAANFTINPVDYGFGLFGTTNTSLWVPGVQLAATSASSSTFQSLVTGFFNQMSLTNSTSYFENLSPTTNAAGVIVWRAIFLQDFSPANVTKTVYFGQSDIDFGASTFHIEWAGAYRDPVTGSAATNYFYLSDEPTVRRDTNLFFGFPPNDFETTETAVKANFANAASTPGFVNPVNPQFATVTNDYSYTSFQPTASAIATNMIVGGSVTNLPGRIQLSASDSMNLANARISGANYLSLSAPANFLGNSNAVISAPFADLNLGVTNGSLTFSNLLVPAIPVWAGVPNAPSAVFNSPMDGLQAWSASFFFVDTNGITNDVQVLLVNSALQPTAPTYQQNIKLHTSNALTINDTLNIFGSFSTDAKILTVGTNDSSGFSTQGEINLLAQNIFWSTSAPNIQYLTNFGKITSTNLMVFAGNVAGPFSDFNAATPYKAFVNDGTIVNQGTFVRADYFENNGTIQEAFANNLDVNVTGTAIATNGAFIAPQGEIAIAAKNLFASNGVIQAGQDITLTTPCFLSDGYVFSNMFGHITNSVLPNVVTNGNIWSAGGGIRIMTKPASGDLLGTTITNASVNGSSSTTIWPGEDRGRSPSGFVNNLAVGQMILNVDTNGGILNLTGLNGSGAIYVDSLVFQGTATNTDGAGNPAGIAIQPGMTVYYAQALQNGVSVAEKIDGKTGAASAGGGGRFLWVSNYAGVYSSTNIQYPDGNTYIFNAALAVSPDIDSDGDLTVNRDDPTPIPTGVTFDFLNNGPQPCGIDGNPGNPGDPSTNAPDAGNPLGSLPFPVRQQSSGGGSGTVSFTLAQGSYNGLFYETNGVNPSTSGFFTAQVTSKGGLTAKLTLGSHTYSFSKPPFDSFGHYSGSVTGKGLPTLTVDLQLVNNNEIVGQVAGDGWTAQLQAERAGFGSKTKAPWAGNDTLLLQSGTNSTASAGDGFGTVSVNKNGDVQWSGTLPDGTKVSQKSALSKDGVWPVYSSLYSGAGAFIGWLQCTNSSDIIGSGVWVVRPGASGLYPNGLTNELKAVGSQTTGSAGALAHSIAILSGESLTPSITNNIAIINKTSVGGSLQLSVNLKTGLFTGSVIDPGSSQKLSIQGALLEKSGIGGGFFLNPNQDEGGKIYLAPAN